jgi:hypothetical protein
MAEVQTSTQTGELSQRFIEFVMMHAQNAALFLGQIPNPKTGQGEVNLELAKMFIDQLEMIREKTRGNLTTEETAVLRNTLSNLQMAYVDAAQKEGKSAAQPGTPQPEQATPPPKTEETPAEGKSVEQTSTSSPEQAPPIASTEAESKKKFTKRYGS